MKSYKLTKRKKRIHPIIINSIPLPHPKLPISLITNIHKPEVYVEFVFEEPTDLPVPSKEQL